jgi:hypothetical protein
MKKLVILLSAISVFMVTTALTKMSPVNDHNVVSIKTDKVDLITMTSVRCFFSIAGNNMSVAGVCLNLTGSPVTPSKIDIPLSVPAVLLNSVKPRQFNVGVKGLSWNTTYHIRAYVKNNDGSVVYGNELVFKTLPKP